MVEPAAKRLHTAAGTVVKKITIEGTLTCLLSPVHIKAT